MTSNDPKFNDEKKEIPPVPPSEPVKKSDMEDFYTYAKSNIRDMIAYALMVIGIILLFFQPIYGGLLIGIVAGVYFSKEILNWIETYPQFLEDYGLVRSVVLGGLLLALFI